MDSVAGVSMGVWLFGLLLISIFYVNYLLFQVLNDEPQPDVSQVLRKLFKALSSKKEEGTKGTHGPSCWIAGNCKFDFSGEIIFHFQQNSSSSVCWLRSESEEFRGDYPSFDKEHWTQILSAPLCSQSLWLAGSAFLLTGEM